MCVKGVVPGTAQSTMIVTNTSVRIVVNIESFQLSLYVHWDGETICYPNRIDGVVISPWVYTISIIMYRIKVVQFLG